MSAGSSAGHAGGAGERRGPGEEVAPAQRALTVGGLKPFRRLAVGELAAGEPVGVVGSATDHGSRTTSQS